MLMCCPAARAVAVEDACCVRQERGSVPVATRRGGRVLTLPWARRGCVHRRFCASLPHDAEE
jgi:hypothetical protein